MSMTKVYLQNAIIDQYFDSNNTISHNLNRLLICNRYYCKIKLEDCL